MSSYLYNVDNNILYFRFPYKELIMKYGSRQPVETTA